MLESEAAIIARLKNALAGTPVFSAGVAAAGPVKALPCIIVGLAGFAPGQVNSPQMTRITTEIMVVALVRNISGESAAEKASSLLRGILSALKAWSPGEGYSALKFTGGGTPDYDEPGMAAFPLSFTCEQTI